MVSAEAKRSLAACIMASSDVTQLVSPSAAAMKPSIEMSICKITFRMIFSLLTDAPRRRPPNRLNLRIAHNLRCLILRLRDDRIGEKGGRRVDFPESVQRRLTIAGDA